MEGRLIMRENVFLCQHCGNENRMDLVCQNKIEEGNEDWDYFNYIKVYRCSVCLKATITETDYFSEDYHPDGVLDENIIYPPNELSDENVVPMVIINAFKSSQRVRHMDKSIFLMSIRRTLEVICNDKGAAGRTLETKIQYLADKGILPASLRTASGFTRILGNRGAHSTDSVNDEVSLHLLTFVKYIIDYVYVLPEKLSVIAKFKKMG